MAMKHGEDRIKSGQAAAPGRRQLLTSAATGLAIGAGVVSAGSAFVSHPAEADTGTGVTDWLNVQQYGATGDGVTDDTAAIQAAVTAAVTPGNPACGSPVYIPHGTYSISSTLDWTGEGLTVIGAGAYQTSIIQATANTIAVHVGGKGQRISGLTIGYASLRPSSETSSVCMTLSSNANYAVMARYCDLILQNGQTGLARDPSCTHNVPLFSCVLENISVRNWSQSAIYLDTTGEQCTGCVFNNIYCNNGTDEVPGTSAGYPVYIDNFTESVWNQLNVEASALTTSAIFVGNFFGLTFNSVHCEGNAFTVSDTAIFEIGGTRTSALTVNSLTTQLCTVDAGITASAVLFSNSGGWAKSAIVNGWVATQLNMKTGASLYFANFGSLGVCHAWLKTAYIPYMSAITGLQTGGNGTCAAFWNDQPAGVLGPPAVPATATAHVNTYQCHAMVYVTAGSAATTVAVDGHTMAVLPAGAVSSFEVPAGSAITLTYASGTPTWKWYGIP